MVVGSDAASARGVSPRHTPRSAIGSPTSAMPETLGAKVHRGRQMSRSESSQNYRVLSDEIEGYVAATEETARVLTP